MTLEQVVNKYLESHVNWFEEWGVYVCDGYGHVHIYQKRKNGYWKTQK